MILYRKGFFLLIAMLFITAAIQAQSVKWSNTGDAYTTTEDGAIVLYTLPSFTKTTIVSASQLVPAGKKDTIKIADFSLSEDGKQILIFTNTKRVWRRNTRGDYWLYNLATNTLKQVGVSKPASSLMFAKISPNGQYVAYVSGHNIYTEDINTGAEKALTTDGTDRMINGTFDWVYEEEFSCRDGFRWSADSKNIAYWQLDATKIRNFLMINNTDSVYSYTIPVEYPKAGEDPSPCKVGVVNVGTAQTTWMNVPGDSRQHYIPRMEWAANNTELILEQLNRKQNSATIFLCNTATGAATPVYAETEKTWIDIKATWSEEPEGWEWIKNGNSFLWISEKDGWRHLYSMDRTGKNERLITKGNYDIITLKTIDEKSGYVYFMASPKNATQQYLYRIAIGGKKEAELLSDVNQQGTHSYNISPLAKYATHRFSNHKNESVAEWIDLKTGKNIKTIPQRNMAAKTAPPPVEMIQITTDDNVTLDGWMIKPTNFDSTKKYPVLFFVYTEPAMTTVKDEAGNAKTRLYVGDMAADGYIQISLDGRGTPAPKGAAWRKSIYKNIGIINVHDQAMAAKKILQWKFVDTSRIAVHGWSGGGSTTLNLMFQYPDIYKTGIAIAPVANQLLYDNIYQERYMGLPQEDKQPFINGSPITYAKNLRGNLLVVHGTGDDNVHYQGTEMLINELVKNGKQFQMMAYPNRTHAIREGAGTYEHLSQMFTDFLKTHCPGGGVAQ